MTKKEKCYNFDLRNDFRHEGGRKRKEEESFNVTQSRKNFDTSLPLNVFPHEIGPLLEKEEERERERERDVPVRFGKTARSKILSQAAKR